jgi:hypothetical protein
MSETVHNLAPRSTSFVAGWVAALKARAARFFVEYRSPEGRELPRVARIRAG